MLPRVESHRSTLFLWPFSPGCARDSHRELYTAAFPVSFPLAAFSTPSVSPPEQTSRLAHGTQWSQIPLAWLNWGQECSHSSESPCLKEEEPVLVAPLVLSQKHRVIRVLLGFKLLPRASEALGGIFSLVSAQIRTAGVVMSLGNCCSSPSLS